MTSQRPLGIEFKYRWVGMPFRCCYCATIAGDIDHTVPRSHVREFVRAYRRHWFPKVTACVECNSILGAQIFPAFHLRKRHVAGRLMARNSKVLRAAGWAPDEVAALGYTLRTKIKSAMERGKAAADRVAFASIPTTAGVPDDLFGQFLTQQEEGEHADLIDQLVA